jgi:electron transfer flavoprotein alpha subunit
MRVVVLAKVVPDADRVGFDPVRHTVVREGPDQFVNPFDLRAVHVALALRPLATSVTLLSMGPPSVGAALRLPLALGADRVVLLSDPALAGSDTLVTARVLARGIRKLGFDLVLTGTWSTDSETGQVPAELATLLEVPVLTQARRLDASGAPELIVDSDTEEGWVREAVHLPAVVSVGEKITKLRKLTEAEVAADSRSIEPWTLADLGIPASDVGLDASPTVVSRVWSDAPRREPILIEGSDVGDQIRRATAEVGRRLLASAGPAPARRDATPVLAIGPWFHVLATNERGALDPEALPVLSAIRRELPQVRPSAVWVGARPSREDESALARAGAQILFAAAPAGAPVGPTAAAAVLGDIVNRGGPAEAVAAPASRFGRAAASHLGASEAWGLIGDVVAVRWAHDGGLEADKPAFGGGYLAAIRSRTTPTLLTVRPGAFGMTESSGPGTLPLRSWDPPAAESRIRTLDSGVEVTDSLGDADRARILLVVGRGLGGPANLPLVQEAAHRLGAGIVATRKVVDEGWLPRQRQVGLTGRSYAPELAVLLGVGGAPNHLVGLRRARVLLAVNSEAQARVFASVDVGLVADWAAVLPGLTEALARLLPPLPPPAG